MVTIARQQAQAAINKTQGPGGISAQQATPTQGGAVTASGQLTDSTGKVIGMANPKDRPGYTPTPQPGKNLDGSPLPTGAPETPQNPLIQNAQAGNYVPNKGAVLPPNPNTMPSGMTQESQTGIPDLSQKMNASLEATKQAKTPVPETQGGARPQIDKSIKTYDQQNPQTTAYQPSPNFLVTGTPILQQYIQEASDANLDVARTGRAVERLKVEMAQGVANLNTEELNLNSMMYGTVDDLRSEMAKAGAFTTESAVQAMASARNHDLLRLYQTTEIKKASLQAQMTAQVGFAQADQAFAESKYNAAVKGFDMQKAVVDNNQKQVDDLVSTIGYSGIRDMTTPYEKRQIEQTKGWPSGFLDNPPATITQKGQQLSTERLQLSNIRTQYSTGNGIRVDSSPSSNNQTLPPAPVTSPNAPTIQTSGVSPALKSLQSGTPIAGLTQGALYNAAVKDMLGEPVSRNRQTYTAVQNKEAQIMDKMGLTPLDVAAAKSEFKSMSAANTKLYTQAQFVKTYTNTATDNLDAALAQSAQVARSGSKVENHYSQWAQGNFTPAGPLAKFEVLVYTASREYAKVTSGGAASSQGLTDSAQKEADKLLNVAQSPEAFKSVVQAMQTDMANVNKNLDSSLASFAPNVAKLLGVSPGTNGQDKHADAGRVINYKGARYTVGADGSLTPAK